METTFDYFRQFGPFLAERILETYPPLQSTKDPVAPGSPGCCASRYPLRPLAITGTAKYLRQAKAARIVAECGAGKTLCLWGRSMCYPKGSQNDAGDVPLAHHAQVGARGLADHTPRPRPSSSRTCATAAIPPSPTASARSSSARARRSTRASISAWRRCGGMGRKEWRKRFTGPTFFITGKDKGKLSYFWDHVYLKAKSGPNLGGIVNPDSGEAILDSEMEKLTPSTFATS